MKLSVREAKSRFAEAAAAAARGERVIVTKYGKPFIEMVAAQLPEKEDFFVRLDRVRTELGLDGLKIELPDNFDDPAFSRKVLGVAD
jgi:antitoxin (DNA-binding transcriptional repressor) of toxin-antitoxin stability system